MTGEAPPPIEVCARCKKPGPLCICDRVVELASRTAVLIVQHPQEMDVTLGTARLVELMLPGAVTVRPGLSWPNLGAALGRDDVDPHRWAILYPHSMPRELTPEEQAAPVVVLDKRGHRLDLEASPLEGIVVLDGTWSQAKALWWRNPWMVKLPRLVIHPKDPSAYGKVRKQPQRGFLSTLEAVGEALVALGEDEGVKKALMRAFRTLLQRGRDAGATDPARMPKKVRPPRGPADGG
jgi:hypothetical protein